MVQKEWPHLSSHGMWLASLALKARKQMEHVPKSLSSSVVATEVASVGWFIFSYFFFG
jgi:hypothetical protein